METNKGSIEHVEEAVASSSSRRLSTLDNKKGDRALALIGDERISLTDEEVSRAST